VVDADIIKIAGKGIFMDQATRVLEQAFFWGWTASEWTAVATLSLAALTVFIAGFAFWHISTIREENKKALTLDACLRYDTNPIICAAGDNLRQGLDSGDLNANPKKYRSDLVTLFNYLDTVAIGLDQSIYIEDMARDHLESIVTGHVNQYFDSGIFKAAGLDEKEMKCLLKLRNRWAGIDDPPRYRDRR
jgi:hypothetical protein